MKNRALRFLASEVKVVLALFPLILLAIMVASWLDSMRPAAGLIFFSSPVSPVSPVSPLLPVTPGVPSKLPAAPKVAPSPAVAPAPTPIPPPQEIALDLFNNPLAIAAIIILLASAVGVGLWMWMKQ